MNIDTVLLNPPSDDEIQFPVSIHRKLQKSVLCKLIWQHQFFAGLDKQHVELLASLAMETRFEPGQYVAKEGDLANRFYLILDGAVEMQSGSDDGLIQKLGAGDPLGWSWLFEPHFFHFSARAVEPTNSIFFYGTILRHYCEDDHDLGYEIMRRFGRVMVKDWMVYRKISRDIQDVATSFGQNSATIK